MFYLLELQIRCQSAKEEMKSVLCQNLVFSFCLLHVKLMEWNHVCHELNSPLFFCNLLTFLMFYLSFSSFSEWGIFLMELILSFSIRKGQHCRTCFFYFFYFFIFIFFKKGFWHTGNVWWLCYCFCKEKRISILWMERFWLFCLYV